MNISRRSFAAMLAGAPVLVACSSGQTAAQMTQEVVTDATTIANGLLNVLPNMQGVPAATVTQVTTYTQQAETLAQSLSTGMTQSAGQSVVAQIQTDVEDVAGALKPYLAANPQASAILTDVQLALPILLAAVQMVQTAAASPASAAAMARLRALPRG